MSPRKDTAPQVQTNHLPDILLLQAQFELNPAGICLLNAHGSAVSCNRRFRAIWNLPDNEKPIAAVNCHDIIVPYLLHPGSLAFVHEDMTERQQELQLRDGRTLMLHTVPVHHDNGIYGMIWIFHDISEQVHMREQLRHLAYYDALTGLPNRRLFHDLLKHALTVARRQNSMVAVLFLDLDNFKQINDSLGHAAGDRYLCSMADMFRSGLREVDLICRWGGDEFILALPGIKALSDAELVAGKLIRAVREIPLLEDADAPLPGLSIGISLFPSDGTGPDMLIRRADMAMYRAKQTGKNRYFSFPASLPLSGASQAGDDA